MKKIAFLALPMSLMLACGTSSQENSNTAPSDCLYQANDCLLWNAPTAAGYCLVNPNNLICSIKIGYVTYIRMGEGKDFCLKEVEAAGGGFLTDC